MRSQNVKQKEFSKKKTLLYIKYFINKKMRIVFLILLTILNLTIKFEITQQTSLYTGRFNSKLYYVDIFVYMYIVLKCNSF